MQALRKGKAGATEGRSWQAGQEVWQARQAAAPRRPGRIRVDQGTQEKLTKLKIRKLCLGVFFGALFSTVRLAGWLRGKG